MYDPYRVAFPLLRLVDPERAHWIALHIVRSGIAKLFYPPVQDTPALAQTLWGRRFAHPIGLAAGFDKNAAAVDGLLDLGFGFVEVGGVTPRPQPGNPRPRLFRLEADRAVINRLGFNSKGVTHVAEVLSRRPRRGIVGVNLAKNKESKDAAMDYAAVAGAVAKYVDFVVINVSSPNTPGLRSLQTADNLRVIIQAVRAALPSGAPERPPAVLVKIAPDLDEGELAEVVAGAQKESVDGIVVSNTTIGRPDSLRSGFRGEAGGLSGAPLLNLSTEVLGKVYRQTGGMIPLVGVGGVSSGADAYRKIAAGASLVQLYSGLVFEGPGLINRIRRDLAGLLAAKGFNSITQAIGSAHR